MKNYLRYVCAILAVALAVALRYALMPLIGPGVPYVTLFPVTVIVSLLAGLVPAILTGILGALVVDYLFIPPLYAALTSIEDISRMAIMILTSAFVGYVGDVLRAARAKAEKQALTLRESQEDLNRAQAVAHIGSWRLDVRKNELTWSDENHRIFGIPKGTPMTYETFLGTVHPDDREYVDRKWKAGLTGENYDIEHRIIVDGQIKWVREKAYLEFDKDGALLGGFGITQNITERKQMEEELRKSRDKLERRVEERTAQLTHTVKTLQDEVTRRTLAEEALRMASLYARGLLEASLDPLITISPEGKITDVNKATELITGVAREQLIGTDFSNYFTEPKKAQEGYEQVFAQGFVTNYPLTIRHCDGQLTDVLYNAAVYKNEAGQVQGVFAAARDITERKQAEKKILADQEQLRSLTTELILTEERERRAIAAALHDSLGPLLAFSKRELGTIQKSASAGIMGTLDNVRDYISQAIDQTRTLTFDLSPPTLYTFGLEHAIEELTERFSKKGKLKCVLKNSDPIIPPTDDIKILLYRSVRELFVNIAKHAQAKSVQVNLSMVGNSIIKITVEDDGVGFDMTDIDPRTGKSSGFGLFSIHQRLTHVGGQFDIQSEKDKGTKVILLVPLKGKKTKKGE